jgi:protein O-mannosyl-transferase
MLKLFYNKYFSSESLLLLLILIISFLVLLPVSGFDFLSWDDDMILTQNPYVKNLTFDTISHNFAFDTFTFFTYTIFSVFYQIWGKNPMPFHAFSILIHLVNIILVFKLVKNFSKNTWLILFITVLFALHPTRIESVAWISETKGLLMGMFTLLSYNLYIRYLKSNFKTSLYLVISVIVILATLSKIQGLLIPLSFFLFDFYYRRDIGILSILEKMLLLVLLISMTNPLIIWFAIVAFIVFLVLKSKIKERKISLNLGIAVLIVMAIVYFLNMNKINDYFAFYRMNPDSGIHFALIERFVLAGMALAIYLRYLLFPISLNAVYPYPNLLPDGTLPEKAYIWILILLIVFAITVFLIVRYKKMNRIYLFGWLLFLINISIVLHIFPIEGRIVAADRYTYIPFLGLFVFLGFLLKWIFERFNTSSKYLIVIPFIALLILAPLSYSRIFVWKNTHTLFEDVLAKNPNVAFAYSVIGKSYLDKTIPDSAIIYLNKAIAIDSFDPTPYFNRAIAFNSQKEYEKAVNDYMMFIDKTSLNKNKAVAFANIGEIYRNTGQDSLALYYLNTAIELDNQLSLAYNRRGLYYLNAKRINNAISDFAKAVRYNEFNAEALNNLGLAYMMNESFDKAEEMFNKALNLNSEYSLAFDNRAYLKYIKKDFEGAVQDYNREIELTPNYYSAYLNRGRTYAAMQNFDAAINDFTFVIDNDTLLMNALTNRAYAFYYTDDNSNAEKDFIKLTIYYPQDINVWLNIAWFYKMNTDYEKSIEALQKVINIDDQYEPVYVNLGSLYIDLGEFKLAEYYLKEGLSIKSDNQETLFLLGEANRLNGNNNEACYYYNEASELNHTAAKSAYDKYCNN